MWITHGITRITSNDMGRLPLEENLCLFAFSNQENIISLLVTH